jgi:SM-20-related protein
VHLFWENAISYHTTETPDQSLAQCDTALATLLDNLDEQGWAVADTLFPVDLALALQAEAQTRWENGQFHIAGVGRAHTHTLQSDIRGDSVYWLTDAEVTPVAARFQTWIAALQQQLNRHFYLGLKHQEMHFARYETGSRYVRHIDQHRNTPHRKISFVLYLNPLWHANDGGELLITDALDADREITRVLPLLARIVVFRSDTIFHEVLPCKQTRWSLTGWFRTDTPGI